MYAVERIPSNIFTEFEAQSEVLINMANGSIA